MRSCHRYASGSSADEQCDSAVILPAQPDGIRGKSSRLVAQPMEQAMLRNAPYLSWDGADLSSPYPRCQWPPQRCITCAHGQDSDQNHQLYREQWGISAVCVWPWQDHKPQRCTTGCRFRLTRRRIVVPVLLDEATAMHIWKAFEDRRPMRSFKASAPDCCHNNKTNNLTIQTRDTERNNKKKSRCAPDPRGRIQSFGAKWVCAGGCNCCIKYAACPRACALNGQ